MKIVLLRGSGIVAAVLGAAICLGACGGRAAPGNGGEFKTGPEDDVRYTSLSTAPPYVWLYITNKETGAKMEVVAENNAAWSILGPDVGVDGGDVDAWRDFMRAHEGKEVAVSAAACEKLQPWDIAGQAVPADLEGAEKLARKEFLKRCFEEDPYGGGAVPKVYKRPQDPGALIFVKYCILHHVNIRRGCEASVLYVDAE